METLTDSTRLLGDVTDASDVVERGFRSDCSETDQAGVKKE
jgi:hypothetical protein